MTPTLSLAKPVRRGKTVMDRTTKRSIMDRLSATYWVVVGIIGMGRPIVDRRHMFGDDPKNDPYSIDYEPSRRR
jgi:hypothetical protein